MKLHTWVFAISTVLLIGVCAQTAHGNNCDADAGRRIAHAYALAISYPDSLPQFVQQNKEFFHEDGPSIQCGRALVDGLRKSALSMPSPGDIRAQAMDVATRAGAPEMGPKVGDDMVATSLDMLRLASFVEELANTCPQLAAGDAKPYHDTSIYGFSSSMWGMIEQSGTILTADLKAIRDMTMEMSEWMVLNLGAAIPK